ncbi:hypothetical protein [Leptothrix ochracea]|uniref:hypothetical protein n=1 Tax=Leptothrix ochracea TaxID=735331 RepID=UPI0034E2C82A
MKYLKKIRKSINNFITEFQDNPYNFLYEADLQAILFSIAYSNLKTDQIALHGGYHNTKYYPTDGIISTSPVKCEYPGSARFDIAFIDRDDIDGYDAKTWEERGWRNDRFWELPVCAAIELKYMQIGEKAQYKLNGCRKDLEKLRIYSEQTKEFIGISMLLIQSDKQFHETLSSGMSDAIEFDDIDKSGLYW